MIVAVDTENDVRDLLKLPKTMSLWICQGCCARPAVSLNRATPAAKCPNGKVRW